MEQQYVSVSVGRERGSRMQACMQALSADDKRAPLGSAESVQWRSAAASASFATTVLTLVLLLVSCLLFSHRSCSDRGTLAKRQVVPERTHTLSRFHHQERQVNWISRRALSSCFFHSF